MLVVRPFALSIGVPSTVGKRRIFSLEAKGSHSKQTRPCAARKSQRFHLCDEVIRIGKPNFLFPKSTFTLLLPAPQRRALREESSSQVSAATRPAAARPAPRPAHHGAHALPPMPLPVHLLPFACAAGLLLLACPATCDTVVWVLCTCSMLAAGQHPRAFLTACSLCMSLCGRWSSETCSTNPSMPPTWPSSSQRSVSGARCPRRRARTPRRLCTSACVAAAHECGVISAPTSTTTSTKRNLQSSAAVRAKRRCLGCRSRLCLPRHPHLPPSPRRSDSVWKSSGRWHSHASALARRRQPLPRHHRHRRHQPRSNDNEACVCRL